MFGFDVKSSPLSATPAPRTPDRKRLTAIILKRASAAARQTLEAMMSRGR